MNFSPFGNPFTASISGIHQFAASAQVSSLMDKMIDGQNDSSTKLFVGRTESLSQQRCCIGQCHKHESLQSSQCSDIVKISRRR